MRARKLRAFAWALILTGSALPAPASDDGRPSILAPHRFSAPGERSPTGLDEEKARLYREQLRDRVRVEERSFPPDATALERRRETRSELERMNRVLQPAPVGP